MGYNCVSGMVVIVTEWLDFQKYFSLNLKGVCMTNRQKVKWRRKRLSPK